MRLRRWRLWQLGRPMSDQGPTGAEYLLLGADWLSREHPDKAPEVLSAVYDILHKLYTRDEVAVIADDYMTTYYPDATPEVRVASRSHH